MTMYKRMEVKVGDTFDYNDNFPIIDHNNLPIVYGDWDITAEVTLFGDGRRKVVLEAYWLDTHLGRIRIKGPTNDWKVGAAQIDIKFTSPTGQAISTESIPFWVMKD